jgi:hypothetical protein
MTDKVKKLLYGYVIHYSEYTDHWSLIPRDQYREYWGVSDSKGVISRKTLEELYTYLDNLKD